MVKKGGQRSNYKLKKLKIKEFIKRAKVIHKNKYSYKKFKYITSKTKSIIICPIHGDYLQSADSHINKGSGCTYCWGRGITTKSFIKSANAVHNNFYKYPKFIYVKSINNGIITCPIHGDFLQIPNNHLNGQGCPKCRYIKSSNKQRGTKAQFFKKAKKLFNSKYSYGKVIYKTCHSKVKIKCKKHGYFWKSPAKHLRGQGCPNCSAISIGENVIKIYLKYKKIKFFSQKRFKTCKNKYELPFDFYLPKLKLLIEYDGRQHFGINSMFCKGNNLKRIQKNDSIKTRWAKKNGYRLLRIPYTKFNKIKEVLIKELIKN